MLIPVLQDIRTIMGAFLVFLVTFRMISIITGAKGFIGKHLVSKLPGDYITILHNEIQSTKIKSFDYFYFLSSYGNLSSQDDENEIYKANIEDLLSILTQIKDIKFKSFVFISTSSVMLKTQTTYSRCKRAAEEILLAFMERHDLPICIIRPFSVTGVGEQPEHLIPSLIRSCYTGTLMNFVSEATHDWIDVEDVSEGILMLSRAHARGIFQLGTGIKTTNQQVLELVEKVTGKKTNVNKVNSLRAYDNQDWVSTNFKARGFGWLPKKTLEQSIIEQAKDIHDNFTNQI